MLRKSYFNFYRLKTMTVASATNYAPLWSASMTTWSWMKMMMCTSASRGQQHQESSPHPRMTPNETKCPTLICHQSWIWPMRSPCMGWLSEWLLLSLCESRNNDLFILSILESHYHKLCTGCFLLSNLNSFNLIWKPISQLLRSLSFSSFIPRSVSRFL